MNEYKLFVQRLGLVGITNLFISLSGLILLPILTKNLSIEDYGVWVQVTVTINLILYFANLGLPYTMVRFLAGIKDKQEIQEGFYSIFFMIISANIIISLFLLLLAEPISEAIFNGNIIIVWLLPLIILFNGLNLISINFFRTFQQMKKYSILNILMTYLNVFFVTLFSVTGYGISFVVFGLIISQFILFLITFYIIISNIGFKIPKFNKIKDYLSFGLPTIPFGLSYYLVESSDRYIIGILLGSTFVGYYSPGYMLGSIITMFIYPFTALLLPTLSKLYDEDKKENVKKLLNYSLKFYLIIGIPSVFGLSALSKPILTILSTTEIALNGFLVTPLVAISALIYGVYGFYSQIIVLEKKTRILGFIWFISAIINIILNILFIPYIGILGAAIMTLISYIIALVLTVLFTKNDSMINVNLKMIFKIIIASILMTSIISICNPKDVSIILTTIILGSAIYFTIILMLGVINKDEIKFLKTLIKP